MFKAGDRVRMRIGGNYINYDSEFKKKVIVPNIVGVVTEASRVATSRIKSITWVEWPITGGWKHCNINTEDLDFADPPCPMTNV